MRRTSSGLRTVGSFRGVLGNGRSSKCMSRRLSIFLKKNRNADIRISTVRGVSLHFLQQVPLESLNMRGSQAAPTMATSTGLRFVMFLAFVRRVKQVRSAGRGGI